MKIRNSLKTAKTRDKNCFLVRRKGRVYVLNKWEAANPTKVTALQNLTISSIQLINQTESGLSTISGVFDDTLQFSQKNFTTGATRFTECDGSSVLPARRAKR